MNDQRIAVIGGGLAGLAAAYALQRRGAAVTLYESEDRVGGRAITDEVDGVSVDAGAQLFAAGYERFLGLAREVGLGSRLARVPGRDALWRDGRAHDVVYGSVTSMVASGGLPFRTKMRLGATYVPFLTRHARALDLHAPERAAPAGLDGETIEAWGVRELDDAFVRALVYPQLGAYYGSLPDETSAGFYHILARQGMDVALYGVAGGVGGVAERLAETILEGGGEVRLGASVEEVRVEGAGGGVRVAAGGEGEPFDGAVLAVPAPVALAVATGLPAALAEWLGAVRYRPSLTLALALDRPSGAPYFGLSFPRGETRFVVAVAVQERKGVPLVPAGRGMLLAFATPEAAPSLVGLDSREVLDRMLLEVARAFPGLEARITRARVYRWTTGTPVFFPGYLRHLGAFREADLERGAPIALAGDYLLSPSAEGAVGSGLAAAARLASRL